MAGDYMRWRLEEIEAGLEKRTEKSGPGLVVWTPLALLCSIGLLLAMCIAIFGTLVVLRQSIMGAEGGHIVISVCAMAAAFVFFALALTLTRDTVQEVKIHRQLSGYRRTLKELRENEGEELAAMRAASDMEQGLAEIDRKRTRLARLKDRLYMPGALLYAAVMSSSYLLENLTEREDDLSVLMLSFGQSKGKIWVMHILLFILALVIQYRIASTARDLTGDKVRNRTLIGILPGSFFYGCVVGIAAGALNGTFQHDWLGVAFLYLAILAAGAFFVYLPLIADYVRFVISRSLG